MGSDARFQRSWSSKTAWAAALLALGLMSGVVAFLTLGAVFVWGRSAEAVVVDVEERHQGSCAGVFEYVVDGRVVRAASRVSSAPCPWSKGERATVYFAANTPDEPRSAAFWEVAMPLMPSALLLVAGLVVALRRPRASEILESAPAVAAAEVSRIGRHLVRVQGALEARGPLLEAPFTGRPCLLFWARLSRRDKGGALSLVGDSSRAAAFAVRDGTGTVEFAAGTPLRLKIDADTEGGATAQHRPAIERFLEQLGRRGAADPGGADDLVWYEAVLVADDAVELAGFSSSREGTATFEPVGEGVVVGKV